MKRLLTVLLAFSAILGFSLAGMSSASAATVPSSQINCPSGQHARPSTPGPSSVPGGQFYYVACSTSGRNYATIRTIYNRTASGNVNADFEWYWVDSNNQQQGAVHHDGGSFTAVGGNWYSYTWTYNPPTTNGGYCILELVRIGATTWYLSPRIC